MNDREAWRRDVMAIGGRGRARRIVTASVMVLAVILMLGCGPIGPLSGGRLSGEEGNWPIDWNSAVDLPRIQLETAPDDPHSVNVWVVVVDSEAYIATSLLAGPDVPDERTWVQNVASDPLTRIRVNGTVYRARLERLADSALIARVFEAFRAKYPELEASRGDAARFYRIAKQQG